MTYSTYELLALTAPLWGLSADDLQGVTIVGVTKDDRIVWTDSDASDWRPLSEGGPDAPTATMTPQQQSVLIQKLLWITAVMSKHLWALMSDG